MYLPNPRCYQPRYPNHHSSRSFSVEVHSANQKPIDGDLLFKSSVTIFETFAAKIPDLDLGRFKVIQG